MPIFGFSLILGFDRSRLINAVNVGLHSGRAFILHPFRRIEIRSKSGRDLDDDPVRCCYRRYFGPIERLQTLVMALDSEIEMHTGKRRKFYRQKHKTLEAQGLSLKKRIHQSIKMFSCRLRICARYRS